MYQSQVRLNESLNDAPLKTRAIREQEEQAKAAKYPTVSTFHNRTKLCLGFDFWSLGTNTSQVSRPNHAREDVSLIGQDQGSVRLCLWHAA